MFDAFNRRIHYLRISVTDLCNLRCVYCMPAGGVPLLSHDEILSFEEIAEITRIAVGVGIDKVRLTGGEPLVRRGVIKLVSMLAGIEGIKDYAMTTNGVLLQRYARDLAGAGLQRINVSLDTLDAEKYERITRGGNVEDVLRGIEAAIEAGLRPVKINCVVNESADEKDAVLVAEFAERHQLEVRFIRRMNLSSGQFWKVDGGTGGDCKVCNRLRLSSNGLIKPCLFSDLSFSVRELGIENAIRKALENKPDCGSKSFTNTFYKIGG